MSGFGYSPVLGQTDFPITNLITNGNFSNGVSGWNAYSATISVASNILSNTANGTALYGRVGQLTTKNPSNHVVYYKMACKVTNENCASIDVTIRDGTGGSVLNVISQTNPLINTVYNISATKSLGSLVNTLFIFIDHKYASTGVATGKTLEIQNAVIVDLTATFGAGNEPTATEMDELLTYFPDSWFDGTVNLANYKWFMIYLLKKIRTLTAAFVAHGGII